jgi:hypothetical protein
MSCTLLWRPKSTYVLGNALVFALPFTATPGTRAAMDRESRTVSPGKITRRSTTEIVNLAELRDLTYHMSDWNEAST